MLLLVVLVVVAFFVETVFVANVCIFVDYYFVCRSQQTKKANKNVRFYDEFDTLNA